MSSLVPAIGNTLMASWGGNSLVGSVLGSLSCLMQHHGFNPPLKRIFLVERIFPLELLTWLLTPFPKNSLRLECKPRSSLCTHAFHRMDSKTPDIHALDRWMLETKTHPAYTIHEDECDYRNGWITKRSHTKISPKMAKPRDIAGNVEEEEEEEDGLSAKCP